MEEHDGTARKAIERSGYELCERAGFKHGNDQSHWLEAEQEAAIQEAPFSIENGAVMIRVAVEEFSGSTIFISISAHSVLLLGLKDDPNGNDEADDLLRLISLPGEVDPDRVRSELDDVVLRLSLPLAAAIPLNCEVGIESSNATLVEDQVSQRK